jgi:rubrerythrin
MSADAKEGGKPMPANAVFHPFDTNRMPLEQQYRSWNQQAPQPYDKTTVDPYTRCRVILMNGIENDSWLFLHQWYRHTPDEKLRGKIVESQQQTTANWLNPADQSVLETTIAYEQVAVDLTANLAKNEPDPYAKQVLDFALIEDFDHLFRYAYLMQMLEGKSAETIVKGRTEIAEGRPTPEEHRYPTDMVRRHIDAKTADVKTRLNSQTITAAEQQTYLFYKSHGFMYGDELARRLYAEIAEVEEEHVTQYESVPDPRLSWFDKAALKQVNEAYNYYSCWQTETDSRLKGLWEQFYRMELEHVQQVGMLLQEHEGKDIRRMFPADISPLVVFESNKEYVRNIVNTQRDLQPYGTEFKRKDQMPADWATPQYMDKVNREGVPSREVVERVTMPA